MIEGLSKDGIARWGFIIIGTIVIFLFWKIIEPFVVVLLTAAVAAVVVTPLEKKLRKIVKYSSLSSILTILFVFIAIMLPLTLIGILLSQQAVDIVNGIGANPDWATQVHESLRPIVSTLPTFAQNYVNGIDFEAAARGALGFITGGAGNVFSSGIDLILKTIIFVICLYFFMHDRDKITSEFTELSPFKDSVDRNIVTRMVESVRGVVFGSLIVSILQGISAGIAFTIFGVPGGLIWAAVVVIATQVPTFGSTTITMPAVLFLLLTGHTAAAIGLFIWAVAAIMLIDNVIQPYVVGRQSNMHALLILLSVLGGINFFGPIGFILGPTTLAAFLVVIELYKSGILEKRNVV